MKLKLDTLLPHIVSIAQQAGSVIMQVYNHPIAIEYKADKSPVTQADMLAHQLIVKALTKLSPQLPILSEEQADIDWHTRRTWQHYWLVDPIDGTKEFINKNGEFTVNIALISHGIPVLGVVCAPALNTTYYAAKGIGSYKIHQGTSTPLQAGYKSTLHGLKLAASRSHPSPQLSELLNKLPQVNTVSVGSSLKFCLIAQGKADVYPRLGATNEWDTGAGHAIALYAGATISQLDNTPLLYNQKESYLNPPFLVSNLVDKYHGELAIKCT